MTRPAQFQALLSRLWAALLIAAVMATSSAPAFAGTLTPVEPGFVKAIASAHKGRPTIVHFWGVTCSICMTELKEWGDFAKTQGGFDLVLVNWDARSATPDRIALKLRETALEGAENWILGAGFEERLRFETDPDWMGELPYTRLIAKDGSVTTFSGEADFARLKAWLASDANK